MTKVRVISGKHTGAFIDWTRPLMKVGSSEDFDIYIGDWNAQTIELVRTPEGHCQAQWLAGSGELPVMGSQLEGNTYSCSLEQWVPVRFGAIILCIGPANEPWPADADLLQRLFAPPPPPPLPEPVAVAAKPPARWRKPLMVAGLTLVAVASSAAVLSMKHGAPLVTIVSTPKAPIQTLRDALADKRWPELEVLDQHDKYVVRGVLESREDAAEVHQRLDTLRLDKPVIRHFMAAAAIAELVHESIPDAGLEVKRVGSRRFQVTGASVHRDRTNQTLTRLGADLDHVGVTVVSSVDALVVGSPRISGTLTDREGLSFARTRDGVKHIVSITDPATAASAARSATTH